MALNASHLDRLVTVRRVTWSNGPLGATMQETDLFRLWAARADISDAEKAAAGQVQSTVAARFTFRASPLSLSIRMSDKLVQGGQVFAVKGRKEAKGARGAFIEISAEASLDQ